MSKTYEKILNTKISSKLIAAIFIFALIYTIGGCGNAEGTDKPEPVSSVETVATQVAEDAQAKVSESEGKTLSDINMLEGVSSIEDIFGYTADTSANESSSQPQTATASGSYEATVWNEQAYPEYYRVDGNAIISYEVNEGIEYAGLDEMGRTTWAAGKITSQMRADAKARGRQDFSSECDKITGWGHNAKVTIPSANGTKDYNGYMYNRSHLIADSLGGDATRVNLVTGTRCQNVGNSDNQGGMAYAEEMARDYLDNHANGWIYYSATPVYVDDEMVCRSVYVDILSDDGSIDEHIEVYNVAKGYEVNYDDGTFRAI